MSNKAAWKNFAEEARRQGPARPSLISAGAETSQPPLPSPPSLRWSVATTSALATSRSPQSPTCSSADSYYTAPEFPEATFVDETYSPSLLPSDDEDPDALPNMQWALYCHLYPSKWQRTTANVQSYPEMTQCDLYVDGFSIHQSPERHYILRVVLDCNPQDSSVELRLLTHPASDGNDLAHKREVETTMSVFFHAWCPKDDPTQYRRNPGRTDIPSDFSSELWQAKMMSVGESQLAISNPLFTRSFRTSSNTQGVLEFKSMCGVPVNTAVNVTHRPKSVQRAV